MHRVDWLQSGLITARDVNNKARETKLHIKQTLRKSTCTCWDLPSQAKHVYFFKNSLFITYQKDVLKFCSKVELPVISSSRLRPRAWTCVSAESLTFHPGYLEPSVFLTLTAFLGVDLCYCITIIFAWVSRACRTLGSLRCHV